MARTTRQQALNSIRNQITHLQRNQPQPNPQVRRERNNRPAPTPTQQRPQTPPRQRRERPAIEKPVVQRNRRSNIPSHPLVSSVMSFMLSNDHNYYLGFGGLGDALLLLGTCWNDPKARVVYFANDPGFVALWFDLFKVPVFLHPNIMGQRVAGNIFDLMKAHPNFKQSAHLADGLNYGDWVNEDKYIPRITPYVPWIEKLGKEEYAEPVLVIAPSGSTKDRGRQRYLNPNEYDRLVKSHLDRGYRVFGTGSMVDFHMFGLIHRERFHWLTASKVYDHQGNSTPKNLHQMLQIINCASKVISMDTWLKTYTLMCRIPTTIVKTRWVGHYMPYGRDVTDWIFLNPRIWPEIKVEPIEDII